MMSVLTKDELFAVTGTKISNRQKEVLSKNGIPYLLDIHGRPVVIWDAIKNAAGGAQVLTESNSPRFDALPTPPGRH